MSQDSKRISKKLVSKTIAEGTKNTSKEFYQYQIEKKIRYYYHYKRNGRFVKTPQIELRKEIELRRLNQELKRTNIQFEKEPSNKIVDRINSLKERINIIDKRDMYERYLAEKSTQDVIKELVEKYETEKRVKEEEQTAISKLVELITGEKEKPKRWWTHIEETQEDKEYDWYAMMEIYNTKTKEVYERIGIVMIHRTRSEFLGSNPDREIEHLLREYEKIQSYYFVGKPVKYKQEQRVLV